MMTTEEMTDYEIMRARVVALQLRYDRLRLYFWASCIVNGTVIGVLLRCIWGAS